MCWMYNNHILTHWPLRAAPFEQMGVKYLAQGRLCSGVKEDLLNPVWSCWSDARDTEHVQTLTVITNIL